MVPKNVHVPIPDVIKFRILRCGDCLGLSRPKVITSVLIRRRQEDQKERGTCGCGSRGCSHAGLQAKECKKLLEVAKGNEMDYPLEPPGGMQTH